MYSSRTRNAPSSPFSSSSYNSIETFPCCVARASSAIARHSSMDYLEIVVSVWPLSLVSCTEKCSRGAAITNSIEISFVCCLRRCSPNSPSHACQDALRQTRQVSTCRWRWMPSSWTKSSEVGKKLVNGRDQTEGATGSKGACSRSTP